MQYLKARLGFVGTLLPALGMWSVKQTWKLFVVPQMELDLEL